MAERAYTRARQGPPQSQQKARGATRRATVEFDDGFADFDEDDSSESEADDFNDGDSDGSRISIPHSDLVRLIRGGHSLGRRRKRRVRPVQVGGANSGLQGRKTLYNNPPTHAYVNKSMTAPGTHKEAGKRLHLKFYKDCPSMRSSDMRFRKGWDRTVPTWEQIPNELEYNDSKVPISKSLRLARKSLESRPKSAPPRRTAKDLGECRGALMVFPTLIVVVAVDL